MIVSSNDKGQAYSHLDLGYRFHFLTKEYQVKLISLGFIILSEYQEINLSHGNMVARKLEYYLMLNDIFKPNRDRQTYEAEGKTNESYDADTVRNALKWYNENWKGRK